jgi:hypothetical protein
MSMEAPIMYLACVELADRDYPISRGRMLQLQFTQLDTARVWAEQEAIRHAEATGKAVIFETSGPFMALVWEGEQLDAPHVEAGHALAFAEDTLAPQG